MTVADGNSVKLEGCVALKMTLRRNECILPVRVTRALAHPVVLGMDFISAMGIEINGKKGTWRCSNEPSQRLGRTECRNNDLEVVMVELIMIDGELNVANTVEMERGKESIHLAPLDPEPLMKFREQLHRLIPPEPKIVRVTPLLKHSIDVQGHEPIRQGMQRYAPKILEAA